MDHRESRGQRRLLRPQLVFRSAARSTSTKSHRLSRTVWLWAYAELVTPRIAVAASLIAVTVLAASCARYGPAGSGESGPTEPAPTEPAATEPALLTAANCGWPADTIITYQGWATEAELGLMVSSPTNERMYWLITGEPVELISSQGSAEVRAACAVNGEGLRSFRRIADDWQPPSP